MYTQFMKLVGETWLLQDSNMLEWNQCIVCIVHVLLISTLFHFSCMGFSWSLKKHIPWQTPCSHFVSSCFHSNVAKVTEQARWQGDPIRLKCMVIILYCHSHYNSWQLLDKMCYVKLYRCLLSAHVKVFWGPPFKDHAFVSTQVPEVLLWAREQSETLSPNLTIFTEHFNKMSFW